MAAATDTGEPVWVCEPEDLALVAGRLVALARRIVVRPRVSRGDHRWLVDSPWFDEVERRVIDVADEVRVSAASAGPSGGSRATCGRRTCSTWRPTRACTW